MRYIKELTWTIEKYYAKWLGLETELSDAHGISFIYSQERNKTQYGYAKPFDIYIWYQPERIILSYGDKSAERIDELRLKFTDGISLGTMKELLESTYGKPVSHNIKYVYTWTDTTSDAIVLAADDYPAYLDFFKQCNPGCSNTNWLREYFDEMAAYGLCVGVFDGGRLASCTDAPGIPFMQETVQEIGINTLPEYRGKGYASRACIRCAENIIKLGKCPMWSTGIDNTASQRLAEKVGFVKLADILTVTL